MIELKPCPFCGGDAIFVLVTSPYILKRYRGKYVIAGCKGCKISTQMYFANNKRRSPILNEIGVENAKKKAAEDWNRRAE